MTRKMTRTKLTIAQAYVVLNADKKASIEVVDADLYQRLDANYAGFQGCELISCFEFEHDWSSWEMHPEGDETVILLSGQVTFVLQQEAGEVLVLLEQPGDFVVVPKNIWHTARTEIKTKLLFVTPGEGTQHKPL
ncbi:MAG: cupin domain-containing protein [Pararheinheimera sp.]|nr:cupin domain-containing protein [Rheinheimera sp.]